MGTGPLSGRVARMGTRKGLSWLGQDEVTLTEPDHDVRVVTEGRRAMDRGLRELGQVDPLRMERHGRHLVGPTTETQEPVAQRVEGSGVGGGLGLALAHVFYLRVGMWGMKGITSAGTGNAC